MCELKIKKKTQIDYLFQKILKALNINSLPERYFSE